MSIYKKSAAKASPILEWMQIEKKRFNITLNPKCPQRDYDGDNTGILTLQPEADFIY